MIVQRVAARKLLARCVLLVLFAGHLPAQSVADDPTLDEIIQRLNEWKDSFTNLRVVYEIRNPGQWLNRKPELVQGGNVEDYYRRCEWTYTDKGQIRLETWYYEADVLVGRKIQGNNGRIVYVAKFDETSAKHAIPVELTLHRMPQSGRAALGAVMPIMELWWDRGDWLGKVLQRAHPVLTGYENIDGVRCAGLHRSLDDVNTLWLDLEHDCLPRMQRPDPGHTGWSFHVEEFVNLGNGRWFPKRGTRTIGETDVYEWLVTEVAANEQISPSRFAPPRPGRQTRIWDSTGPTPKLPRGDPVAQLNSASAVTHPGLEGPITAVLPDNRWLWIGLLIGAGSLLVVGIWRRKHS